MPIRSGISKLHPGFVGPATAPRGAWVGAWVGAVAICLAAHSARAQTDTSSGGPSAPSSASSSSSSSLPSDPPPPPWALPAPLASPAAGRAARLSLLPDDVSVYEPPAPPRDDDGLNSGAVSFDLNARFLTDYVYRGVNHNNAFKNNTPVKKSNKLNLQVDTSFSFNLGKFPHPFFGLFANVNDSDPVSRFQEIRPYVGLEWKIRPLILAAGHNSYIFPDRDKINTAEVWGRITLDDSYVFKTETPIFSPYIYGAYDYDLNNGWYFEAGVKHDFVFEDYGLTLTVLADVGYIDGIQQQFIFRNNRDVGFQHYDVGLIAAYSLNRLFKFSTRYGDFTINGYLTYTDGINNRLKGDTQLYGGAGIGFHY